MRNGGPGFNMCTCAPNLHVHRICSLLCLVVALVLVKLKVNLNNFPPRFLLIQYLYFCVFRFHDYQMRNYLSETVNLEREFT
jgi:hypothetical protein